MSWINRLFRSRRASEPSPVRYVAPNGMVFTDDNALLAHTPPAAAQEQFAEQRQEDRLAMQRAVVAFVKNGQMPPQELLDALKIKIVTKDKINFVLKPENYGCDDTPRARAIAASFTANVNAKLAKAQETIGDSDKWKKVL